MEGYFLMRKHLIAAAVAAAGALLAVAPSLPASADSVPIITVGAAGSGGTAANVGDTVTANLESGTTANLTAGNGTIKCSNSTFSGTVTSNPASPGSAAESLSTQSFASCTASGIIGVTSVKSITVQNLPYTATVNDSNSSLTLTAGSAGPIDVSVALNTILGTVTCVFTASSLVGTTSNSNNSVTFTNQSTTLSTGPGVCPKSGTFSAAYGPATDTTQGGGLVFIN
jgi:hypothetical protein